MHMKNGDHKPERSSKKVIKILFAYSVYVSNLFSWIICSICLFALSFHTFCFLHNLSTICDSFNHLSSICSFKLWVVASKLSPLECTKTFVAICCYFRWHSSPPKQLRLPEMSQIHIYCNILALGNWKMSAMCVLYNFHKQFGLFKSSLGESIIIKIIGCIKLISFSSANSELTK